MDNERAWIGSRHTANLLGGLALLILGFVGIQYASDWIDNRWGAVPVCLAYFLLMPVASRLFWKGAESLSVARKLALHPTTGRGESL